MANIPQSAVKKIKNDVHREIAAGILIAYGLFPRTNEGIAAAQRLIAGRETWLAPSGLPNYYDDIESDLMMGRETAGITNIRMVLKEFYGLNDTKPKSQPKLKPANTKPTKPTKKEVVTGETQIYKPDDKFVDDITENLDKKLEETSNDIMDVVDALIEKQKKDFEDFKRKQEEERKRKKEGESQYPAPIGPDPMQGPEEPPVQGPKKPPKKTVAPEKDEDWESEVPDQLNTKLDELLEQVKNDPLPQPNDSKRKKTKGKKPVKKKKLSTREMGLGESIDEIRQNVSETKDALFEMYKVNKARFEFRKKVDSQLTTMLKAKLAEQRLEDPEEEDDDKKKGFFTQVGETVEEGFKSTLIAGLTMLLLPAITDIVRPFMTRDKENEGENQWWDPLDVFPNPQQEQNPDVSEPNPENPIPQTDGKEKIPNIPQQQQSTPAAKSPSQPQSRPAPLPAPQLQLRDTSIPGDPDYRPPSAASTAAAIPLRTAATGGRFTQGKKEPLRPVSKIDVNIADIKKKTAPLVAATTLPQKVGTLGLLSVAKNVIKPFAGLLPQEGRDFITNVFNETARMGGVSNFTLSLNEEESIFDALKKMIGITDTKTGPGGPGGGGGGGGGGGPTGLMGAGDDLRSFIGGLESGNDYTKLVGGKKDSSILGKTVSQLMSERGGKFAMGRYQIQMNSAMDMLKARGIDPKTFKFDEKGQDQLFQMLADRRGYQEFISGKMSKEDFAKNLSKEWAALPTDATGRGFYDGVGTNKSLTSWDNTLKTLDKEKNSKVEPAPPPSSDLPLKPVTPPEGKPDIEKPKTFAEKLMDMMGSAGSKIFTPSPPQQPAAPKINTSTPTQSSKSGSAKAAASQPSM